ncbi:metallophosphoesterase, partial [bacterium]|nr:metallophosphoesterase [bacterium]
MADQHAPRFLLLADLHLSDTPATAAHRALAWAIETINEERPDFLAVAGDITTFGTRPATAHFLAELERVQVPVIFTPGNAELRSDEGLPLLRDRLAPANRHYQSGALSALFPDTS